MLRYNNKLDLLGTLPWCCLIALWATTQHQSLAKGLKNRLDALLTRRKGDSAPSCHAA